MIFGQIIGAVGSLIAGNEQADAAEEAARLQRQSQQEAIDLQREQFNKILELNEPFRQSNLRALSAQEDLLGLGGMGGGGGGFEPIGASGGSATEIPNRPSGTMPSQRSPTQFEVPGSGVQQGTPGITGPEPGLGSTQGLTRFRGREAGHQENQIRALDDPRNVLQMLLRMDQNNPHVQSAINNLRNQLGRDDFGA